MPKSEHEKKLYAADQLFTGGAKLTKGAEMGEDVHGNVLDELPNEAGEEVLAGAVMSQRQLFLRYKTAAELDMFGFETAEYLYAMTFATARPLLKPEAKEADWPEPETNEALNERAKDYMPFWLEKIENERGLSVTRASAHFSAWKFRLGHPDWNTFPGSWATLATMDTGGWYQRDAYDYIKAQMDCGEWDTMTQNALTRGDGA